MISAVRLGELLEREQPRDAIHVAIISVRAGVDLPPETKRIMMVDGLAFPAGLGLECVGVMDPWLVGSVAKGAWFLLLVTHGTITSLRHEWTHPGFPPLASEESIAWLHNEAKSMGVTYDELLGMALLGDVRSEGTSYAADQYRWGSQAVAVFYSHVERVTGRPLAHLIETASFTCGC